jgi:hypothetical protein
MRLSTGIMILLVLQITLVVFDNIASENSFTLSPYDGEDSIIYKFILDPTGWGDSDFLKAMLAVVSVAGVFGVGLYLVTKSDITLLVGVFAIFLGFGSIPIIGLYNFINRNIGSLGCTGLPCYPTLIIWGLTGGVLSIYYVLACLSWWTGRS